jgi:hypothetical protein
MKRFIADHEALVQRALAEGDVGDELAAYHERQVGYLQAERLAHLHVTLAVSGFALVTGLMVPVVGSVPVAALFVILLVLAAAYLVHYYRLENAVQRWYTLSRRLARARGWLPATAAEGGRGSGPPGADR